jgi:hypothetical protein
MTSMVFEGFWGEFLNAERDYFVGMARAGKVVGGLGRRDGVNEKTGIPPSTPLEVNQDPWGLELFRETGKRKFRTR